MAEKISMLIVAVDLDCHKCYHKMRKILCQLQDHERIRTISFDTKSKTITIVGPFDPQRLACKLRCKGGKVVRDVHIVDANTINGGGGGRVENGKKKNKDKNSLPTNEHRVSEDVNKDKPHLLPREEEQGQAASTAGCPGQRVPKYVIPTVVIPSWPAPPVGPCGCPCCAPCYQGYYDSCRCSCCGRVYGTTVRLLPPACGAYRGCRTFSDDDPSAVCRVM